MHSSEEGILTLAASSPLDEKGSAPADVNAQAEYMTWQLGTLAAWARKTTSRLRKCVALAEDLDSISKIHSSSHCLSTPVPQDLAFSDLCGLQACTWYAVIHEGKALTQVISNKINKHYYNV